MLKICIFLLLSILVNSSVYALSQNITKNPIEKDRIDCGCFNPCPEEPMY